MRALVLIIAAMLAIALLAWQLCYVQKPTAVAGLPQKWHEQMYGLDQDEVLRLIPAPYSPERLQQSSKAFRNSKSAATKGDMTWKFEGGRLRGWSMSSGRDILGMKLYRATGLSPTDYDGAKDLLRLPIDGDVCIRLEGTVDRRMSALQSIASAVTGRNLIFEKRVVERDVLVATGTWSYRNLRRDDGVAVDAVHFNVGRSTLRAIPPYINTSNLSFFISRLQSLTGRKVIDEIADPRPTDVRLSLDEPQIRPNSSEASMVEFLEHLERQTSLRFVRTIRPVPIWFISEGSTTAPEGGR